MGYKVLTDGNGSKLIQIVGMGCYMPLNEYSKLEDDLNQASAKISTLESQVNSAFADVFLLSKSLFEAVDVLERELLPALEDKEPLEELISELRSAAGKSPEEHLLQVKAEAISGFINWATTNVDPEFAEWQDFADKYASELKLK